MGKAPVEDDLPSDSQKPPERGLRNSSQILGEIAGSSLVSTDRLLPRRWLRYAGSRAAVDLVKRKK